MKITKERLRTIIKEELINVLEDTSDVIEEGMFDFSKVADKIAGDLDGLEAELNKRIDNLGTLVRKNSAALRKLTQEDPLEITEEKDDFPEKVKKGRFTAWCKRRGFEEGAGIGCAREAMKSKDASVRGMASFYMNTVKPEGKDASDL